LGQHAAMTPGGATTPDKTAVCDRLEKREQNRQAQQNRLSADANTRGSIAWLTAKAASATASGDDALAKLYTDKAALRSQLLDPLKAVTADLDARRRRARLGAGDRGRNGHRRRDSPVPGGGGLRGARVRIRPGRAGRDRAGPAGGDRAGHRPAGHGRARHLPATAGGRRLDARAVRDGQGRGHRPDTRLGARR